MSNALQLWLAQIPTCNGLLGAYLVEPGREPEVRSWSERCQTAGIQALHRQVRDVLDVLGARDMPARKLRWIFEETVVYYERRPDGAGLCLISTHDLWIGEGEVITGLIQDFRNVQPGSPDAP
ncbi:MAG: hypothetical protein MUE94_10720 [Verrucomicrobia bacterium]|jgi:hypothetical protein|nr:hypothetical protein [Verrucomicrobiota bacterium]